MDDLLSSMGFASDATRAAVIGGVFALLGLMVPGLIAALSFRQREPARIERRKSRQYLATLRAELSADAAHLKSMNLDEHLTAVRANYAANPSYSVFVPAWETTSPALDLVVQHLESMPEEVVVAIVPVLRLKRYIARFSSDMRAGAFAALAVERQLAMYEDYVGMLKRLSSATTTALASIDGALAEQESR